MLMILLAYHGDISPLLSSRGSDDGTRGGDTGLYTWASCRQRHPGMNVAYDALLIPFARPVFSENSSMHAIESSVLVRGHFQTFFTKLASY